MERMIARVSGPPPYDWVAYALERFAHNSRLERAPAACLLLDRGLSRDLENVRVMRTFAASRGRYAPTSDGGGKETMIQAISVSSEYADLPAKIEKSLKTLRAQHTSRAKDALLTLAESGLKRPIVSARGWRAYATVDGKQAEGLVFQVAGKQPLNEKALRDACDYVTDDMVTADVVRAVLATELEREGLAPKGWSDRKMIGVGWIHFDKREVR